MWCSGDPTAHLGRIQNIVSTGHIEERNFYPITHIFSTQFELILGVSPIIPYEYTPLLFTLVYVVFIYLPAKSIIVSKGGGILGKSK